ncbi:MAG: Imm1 family immunity protein [Neisseria sp.]|nr:Imm1 family immunity protein [Neisseria sp.]
MYLDDFLAEFVVRDEEYLRKLLKTRHKHSANHFILSHVENGFPQLNIFVKSNQCVLYYMADGESHISAGNHPHREGICVFYENNNGTTIELPCSSVVEEREMETAALAFFKQQARPENIHWQAL